MMLTVFVYKQIHLQPFSAETSAYIGSTFGYANANRKIALKDVKFPWNSPVDGSSKLQSCLVRKHLMSLWESIQSLLRIFSLEQKRQKK